MPRKSSPNKTETSVSEVDLTLSRINNIYSQLNDFSNYLSKINVNSIDESVKIQIQLRISQIEPIFSKFNDFNSFLISHDRGLNNKKVTEFSNDYF